MLFIDGLQMAFITACNLFTSDIRLIPYDTLIYEIPQNSDVCPQSEHYLTKLLIFNIFIK